MAEIRKHDPAVGNAIATALRAAMGDPVRPAEAGSQPASAPPPESKPAATSRVSVRFDTGAAPSPTSDTSD